MASTARTREGGVPIDQLTADASRPSFDEVWRAQRLPMLQTAVMLVDRLEPAEDVVQEAFAGLYRHWADVDDPVAYLRRSVVNGCRSTLRRRRTIRAHLTTARLTVHEVDGADAPVLVAEEHRAVIRALGRIAGRQREILVLKYWHDLSDQSVAQTLGISESAVRAGAARGRQRLAALMEAAS